MDKIKKMKEALEMGEPNKELLKEFKEITELADKMEKGVQEKNQDSLHNHLASMDENSYIKMENQAEGLLKKKDKTKWENNKKAQKWLEREKFKTEQEQNLLRFIYKLNENLTNLNSIRMFMEEKNDFFDKEKDENLLTQTKWEEIKTWFVDYQKSHDKEYNQLIKQTEEYLKKIS